MAAVVLVAAGVTATLAWQVLQNPDDTDRVATSPGPSTREGPSTSLANDVIIVGGNEETRGQDSIGDGTEQPPASQTSMPPLTPTTSPPTADQLISAPNRPYPNLAGGAWLGWTSLRSSFRPAAADLPTIRAGDIAGDHDDAVRAALNQHDEIRLVGTFDLDRPLNLGSGQVIRGEGPEQTLLRFSGPRSGIKADLGGIAGSSIPVDAAAFGGDQLKLQQEDGGRYAPGDLVVLSASGGSQPLALQIASRPDASTLKLTSLLPRAVEAGEPLTALSKAPLVGVGVDNLTLEAVGPVDNLVFFRGTIGSWVANVHFRNVRRAHLYASHSHGCEIRGSFFDDASDHGDGGRGYGVSLANGTTNCLVEDNEFRRLRHSMVVNDGAGGNAFVFNHSWEPRHINFPHGGPPDILVHGPAYANLFEGNVVERIYVGDNPAGPHNVFLRNCLTAGPLSYQYGSGTQIMFGNSMYGTDQALAERSMAGNWPEGESSLPYLHSGPTVFADRAVVRVGSSEQAGALPDPLEGDNQWRGAADGPRLGTSLPSTAFSDRQSILEDATGTDWINDCPIDAVVGAGRGPSR